MESTFDIEAYAVEYTGRTAILRLLHVATHSPSQETQIRALVRAAEVIKADTLDYELYNVVTAQLGAFGADLARDDDWVRGAMESARREGEKLDAEMRNYSINLIKESTRQTLLAMARHQRLCGDFAAAMKTYQKLRDYQSTAEHELETFLATIEVALLDRQYNVVLPTVIKAQHALSRLGASLSLNGSQGGGAAAGIITGEQARERERKARHVHQVTRAAGGKLGVAKGVALLATGAWEAGVRELVGVRDRLGEWEGEIFSLSDIAVYTSLAALATLSRGELKSLVLENSEVRYAMDHGAATYTRDAVEAFVGAKYSKVLQLLEDYKWRPLYDIHIYQQLPALLATIRHRAYVQYFEPFQNVQLARMAATFGQQGDRFAAFEADVVGLVQAGKLKARVDDIDKVLYAADTDKRRKLYRETLETGSLIGESTRQAFLRMQLHQAGIMVETAQDKKQREQKVRGRAAGAGNEDPAAGYMDGSDEEMMALV